MTKGERISRFVAELAAEQVHPNEADIAKHPFYRTFFQCWNEQRYYEAHDVLEPNPCETQPAFAAGGATLRIS